MSSVLVVDDEPFLREELQESLEYEGYEVACAEDVPQALEMCAEQAFDFIVTDLKMPRMGGLELLEALKKKDYAATVLVVSGHGAESSRDDALRLGAKACFAKPLDCDALIEAFADTA